jgi:FkbM family methyltransferase
MNSTSFVEQLRYIGYFGGVKGLIQAALNRVPILRGVMRFCDQDHEWLGRIVESRGNMVALDGCTYSVSDPLVTTALKSRFLTGRYERNERYAVKKFITGRNPVVELGGSLGAVACITNRKLADPTRHVVVEANPDLIPILQTNRDLNGCRFALENKALSYGAAEVDFKRARTVVESGVYQATGTMVRVATTSLKGILDRHGFAACDLVCDIEGVEAEMFANEAATIRDRVETFVMEFHPAIVGNRRTMDLIGEIEGQFRLVWRRHAVAVYCNRGRTN